MIKAYPYALTLTLALFLSATPLLCNASQEGGGSHAGNGGDVVYCEHPLPGQKRIELLDLFESRVLRDNALALGEEGWDYKRRIAYVLDRLKRLDPYRAGIYADNASHFLDDSEFTTDELPDIPDSLHIALPEGCKIRQIVIQSPQPEAEKKRFLVNKALWEMLDEENRAALVLHETIYREALSLRQTNSINTRLLNGTITSHALDAIDLRDYLNLLLSTEMKNYRAIFKDKATVDYVLGESTYSCFEGYQLLEDCHSAKVTILGNQIDGYFGYQSKDDRGLYTFVSAIYKSFPWPVNGVQGGQVVQFQQATLGATLQVIQGTTEEVVERKTAHYKISCASGSNLSFPNFGKYDKCVLATHLVPNLAEVQGRSVEITTSGHIWIEFDPTTGRLTHALLAKAEEFKIRSNSLTFEGEFLAYPSGNIRGGFLAKAGRLQIPNSSKEISAKAGTTYLYEDGTVQSACLDSFATLTNTDDKRRTYSSGTCLKFDQKGRVEWSKSND
ncbi:MAG: hypothetical protein ACJ763_11655 [Bdellovibrionia bacterium]